PDEHTALMAALPVRKLWGIGPVADEKLRRLGIDTIGQFVATPESEVSSILGATIGPGLHKLARGIDDRAVAERAEAKQVSAETTFAQDLVTLGQLRSAVEAIGDSVHRRLLKDGRGARTIVLKLRKADMSIVTRSLTLPYATVDKQTIVAAALRQVLDPVELGPIRLVGVGLTGLSAVQQGSLFPELDHDSAVTEGALDSVEDVSESAVGDAGEFLPTAVDPGPRWLPGMDVRHPEYGHGWIQGAGHSVVTVRFETRSTGPGRAHTFAECDELLVVADALDSLQ
ncbi:MAG: DNA polymerase IV, partial [Rhodococcus sp. (in: high G+C Gram-positive bacteria)]